MHSQYVLSFSSITACNWKHKNTSAFISMDRRQVSLTPYKKSESAVLKEFWRGTGWAFYGNTHAGSDAVKLNFVGMITE